MALIKGFCVKQINRQECNNGRRAPRNMTDPWPHIHETRNQSSDHRYRAVQRRTAKNLMALGDWWLLFTWQVPCHGLHTASGVGVFTSPAGRRGLPIRGRTTDTGARMSVSSYSTEGTEMRDLTDSIGPATKSTVSDETSGLTCRCGDDSRTVLNLHQGAKTFAKI